MEPILGEFIFHNKDRDEVYQEAQRADPQRLFAPERLALVAKKV
jgi:hypothetical protein